MNVRFVPVRITIMYHAFVLMMMVFFGCEGQMVLTPNTLSSGGGRDAIVADLPFAAGEQYQCTQGPGGSYSHTGTSTRYDADFDTPNEEDRPVYAPVSGTVYVHDTDAYNDFGYHVNIDLGDGSYVILAHLSDIFVPDGSEVAPGQLLGFEGSTGDSTGDHLHMGRHTGSASADGVYGTSQAGFALLTSDETVGGNATSTLLSDFVCGLSTGHLYQSYLAVPLWHPNGSLVKTPNAAAVYLVENGELRTFVNETAFRSRNYNFADVTLVSDDELACFDAGESISGESLVTAVYDDDGGSGLWMLFGTSSEAGRYRQKLPTRGWQGVLKSWGITAATYDDLSQESDVNLLGSYGAESGTLGYRSGALVSPSDASDVYFMSDGIAMPIVSWEAYLMAGWHSRVVIEVDHEEFTMIASTRGSCGSDSMCITPDMLASCGGEGGSFGAVGGSSGDDEEDVDTGEEEEFPPDVEDPDPPEAEYNDVTLTWSTPGNVRADSIVLSGEYTPSGGLPLGWSGNLASSTSASSVTYTRSMAQGDSLRFSVEYRVGSVTSWSCLGPYPPGMVQGTAWAVWNGEYQDVDMADDPTSSGCGLIFTIGD